jgi:hypothetical protein
MPKYTLQMNDKLETILDELAEKDGISKAQVIRRSLTLLKLAEDHKDQGFELQLFREADGDEPEKTKTVLA